jgi:hypothetical protein
MIPYLGSEFVRALLDLSGCDEPAADPLGAKARTPLVSHEEADAEGDERRITAQGPPRSLSITLRNLQLNAGNRGLGANKRGIGTLYRVSNFGSAFIAIVKRRRAIFTSSPVGTLSRCEATALETKHVLALELRNRVPGNIWTVHHKTANPEAL